MDEKTKRGRKAQGHNGRNYSCNVTSDYSEGKSSYDVLQSKPRGSCQIDGSRKAGLLTQIHLCTYNVRTLKSDETLESLLEELEGFKWDIIGLAETKREGDGLIELENGSWLFNRGKTEDNRDAKGVGFLIHPKFKDHIMEVKSYSNRVVALNIQLTGKEQMCVIQVYAPTSDYEDSDVEEFYETINKAIKDNKGKYTVLMGDFNAKLGKQETGEEHILGKFGIGQRNRRGDRLIEFALEQNLIVANTFFKKDKKRYWTWESPDGKTRNQIDFILCSQRGIVKNCEVITNVDIASDHRMVRATICINKKLARLKFINNKRKLRINILRLKEMKEEFQLELRNRFAALKMEDADIDTRCENITAILMEEASSLAPVKKTSAQKSDEDKEIEELDKRRKVLREIEAKTTAEKIEYSETVKTVRKRRRQRMRRRKRDSILQILESGRGPKSVMKLKCKKTRITQLKHKDGSLASDRSEILGICSDFYQELYSSTKPTGEKVESKTNGTELPPILPTEVEEAIRQMKENKAPGPDEITSDVIKTGGEETIRQLTDLYNKILQEKKVPIKWKEAKIILLHKKDDKTDIKNYRPISLLSHMYKIFTKVIQNRIKGTLDRNQPREQAGFRGGFSTTDHLQSVNQLIEKSNEYQLNLCLGFVDYQKAFDSIEHKDMFDALRNIGIEEGYICILEDIYTDATARIHIEKDVSKEVKIERGVRQGDTLSPKIFTAALEEVFKKSNLEEKGINIDGEQLTDLRFADDVALATTSVQDMGDQLCHLNVESKKVGLQMHKGKTKFMTNFETSEGIKIESQQIEKVNSYQYLGQTLKMEDTTKEEVVRRIKGGWRCFNKYKELLTDKEIPLSLRRRIYDQCILTTMTYGAETWATTKEIEQKLRTTQRAMERRMLNLTLRDRVRHSDIRQKTKVKDVILKIKEMKWKWAGHLSRTQDNRWTKKLTEWQPRNGKRRRGRQKRRWRDEISTYTNTASWSRVAADRREWNLLGEGFIQQWMDTA